MNAREHVTEAEKCIKRGQGNVSPELSASYFAEAQAYAAIALAMATIDLADAAMEATA